MTEPTEQEVRALRNQVYDHEIGDKQWEHVRQYWMKPEEIEFLKRQVNFH
jgi:hypothetical protein